MNQKYYNYFLSTYNFVIVFSELWILSWGRKFYTGEYLCDSLMRLSTLNLGNIWYGSQTNVWQRNFSLTTTAARKQVVRLKTLEDKVMKNSQKKTKDQFYEMHLVIKDIMHQSRWITISNHEDDLAKQPSTITT